MIVPWVGIFGLAVCAMVNFNRRARLESILLVLAVQAFHLLAFNSREPMVYFGGAAVCDATIIVLLNFVPHSHMVRDVQYINGAALIAHALGFIGYWLYWPSGWYTHAVAIMSIAQIIRMLILDEENHAARNDGRDSVVHRADCAGGPVSERGRP